MTSTASLEKQVAELTKKIEISNDQIASLSVQVTMILGDLAELKKGGAVKATTPKSRAPASSATQAFPNNKKAYFVKKFKENAEFAKSFESELATPAAEEAIKKSRLKDQKAKEAEYAYALISKTKGDARMKANDEEFAAAKEKLRAEIGSSSTSAAAEADADEDADETEEETAEKAPVKKAAATKKAPAKKAAAAAAKDADESASEEEVAEKAPAKKAAAKKAPAKKAAAAAAAPGDE